MINRTLIRLKIVQLMYSYYQNGGKNVDTAEKELLFSLSKAYDLYNYLLMLITAVTKHALEQVERQERNNKIAHCDQVVNRRFAENKFALQLEQNKHLNEFKETNKKTWENDKDYIKDLYNRIVATDFYESYMSDEDCDYKADREIWRKIYKNIIMKDERLDEVLEDQSLYWNDDKEIVDTFVLKTIKRFEEENGTNQELMPEYKDIEDREFAVRLFRRSILNDEYYRNLISQNIKNWEFNRLAFMDVIIMQIAIAEILSFPAIPTSVTINEYVEIAKYYSTAKSGSYVNGILDTIVKKLKADNKRMKEKALRCYDIHSLCKRKRTFRTNNSLNKIATMNTLSISLLQAQPTPESNFMPLIMILAMIAIFYFFMYRPQRKRQKELQKFQNSLTVGQRVITSGGIYGTVKDTKNGESFIVIEIANGVKVEIDRNYVFADPASMMQR